MSNESTHFWNRWNSRTPLAILGLSLLTACSVTRELSLQQVGPEKQKYAYREGGLSGRPATLGEGLLDAAGAVFTPDYSKRYDFASSSDVFECECRILEFQSETPCVSMTLLVTPRKGSPFFVKTDETGHFSFDLPEEHSFAINAQGNSYIARFKEPPEYGSCTLHLKARTK